MECSIFIMDKCMFFCLNVIVWCECAVREGIFVRLIASNIRIVICA